MAKVDAIILYYGRIQSTYKY